MPDIEVPSIFDNGDMHNYFTGGLKYGIMRVSALNATIDAYNVRRPWLATQMPHLGKASGWEWSWQHRGEAWGFEMVFGRMDQTCNSSGVNPVTKEQVYDRISAGIGGFSFGFIRTLSESKHLVLYPSLDFDCHFFGASHSSSPYSDFKRSVEEDKINDIVLGNTLAFNVSLYATRWLGINLRPFVQVPWMSADITDVQRHLTTKADGSKIWPVNCGISGTIIVAFGRDVDDY